LSPLLLKLDDGEAEPLETLLSENFWLTPGGSALGSELLLLVLVLEGSELLLLLLELKEGSELLLELAESELLSGPLGGEKFAEGEKPKGDNTLSATTPTGPRAHQGGLPGAATAGITKAATNATTKTPTIIKRRTVTSFSRNG
jgi:hypothetical protein